jgi:hypothetical protein
VRYLSIKRDAELGAINAVAKHKLLYRKLSHVDAQYALGII